MRSIFLCLFLTLSIWGSAQTIQPKYSRVKVFLHETDIAELAALGLEYDHGYLAKGRYWINDVSEQELKRLNDNDFDFEVMIDDVQAWYILQNQLPIEDMPAEDRSPLKCNTVDLVAQYATPENYTYGSMGGYLTYAQLLNVLDDMKAKYPNLITAKEPIGDYTTQEGRPIYWLKIGKNPNVNEDKPAILFNSLHHAREPNSLSQLIFFMWHLLENYEKDAEIQYIMDHVELYFIPCINPDGYVFNETISPQGGGFWRKNRWKNDKGEAVGVDLNRNYGFHWGLNDVGSSGDETSDIYRGKAPFSEPEIQAVRDFCIEHQFKVALNYHSFSNLLIFPWGYEDEVTPDNETFRAMGTKMIEQNNYTMGTALETVGYLVNGDSDDWMYGEQETKPKILSMTPEVGPGLYGFWPPQNAIDRLNKENLWQNISAAGLLKAYGDVIELGPNTLADASGNLNFELKNIGLEAGTFKIRVVANSAGLEISDNEQSFELNHLGKAEFSVAYLITDTETLAQELSFDVFIDNGLIERKIQMTKNYYTQTFETVFLEEVGLQLNDWESTGRWGITKEAFFSEDASITDSPNSNYTDTSVTHIETKSAIDLTNAKRALIKFRAKWELETNFDYVQLLIGTSPDNYQPVCGQYTVMNGREEPAYNGVQKSWILEEIDISEHIGKEIFVRFELKADEFVNQDGFYFDDFSVEIIADDATSITETTAFLNNEIDITPNPFVEAFTIDFTLKEPLQNLSIRLLNALGQEVEARSFVNLGVKKHRVEWQNNNLEKGVYFVHFQIDEKTILSKKILKTE
jgi:hypothetical protein